ncbi:LOW QUALITY PROTEIN: hypothetical protein HID58_034732 [Brassica napus]|uniref:Uncharacterized protein n=1 Tax=Brassica napus TaxID=3708 RepID=A0ABQ8C2X6_BRANA|nr:LOW QUALITY PROTEIN: hypothetical protein HID58_034732 [Brassica napus]
MCRSATWSGPAHDFGPSDVMLLLAHHAGINPSFHKSPPAWFKPNLGPSDNPSADSFLPCFFVFLKVDLDSLSLSSSSLSLATLLRRFGLGVVLLVALPRNRSSMKVSSAPPRWRRISFSPFFPRSLFAERRFASLMMAHTIVTPSSFLPNIPRCLLLTTREASSVSLFLLCGNVWWPKLLHLNRVSLLSSNYPPGSATWNGPAHDFGPSDVMLLLAHHAGINPSFHSFDSLASNMLT